jgi:hypothetical protein
MGFEGDDDRLTVILPSLLLHLPKNRVMPKMDAVEITQGHDRIMEGSL